MAAVSSKFDGFTTHTLTSKKIGTFVDHFEEHMKWLEEVLVEAKNTFASTEIELLPKTPAAKRKRQKRKVADVSTAEESCTDSEVDHKGGRAKRNKRSSAGVQSTKSVSVTAESLSQTESSTETDDTETAASVETAQPTVHVSQDSEEDAKPKRTREKRAPPRASKRTTKRTTRSMSATQKRKLVSSDESCTEDTDGSTASDASQSSRPKRGRHRGKKAKKEEEPEPVLVADSGIETRSSMDSTNNGERALQSKESPPGASNEKDAVRKNTRGKKAQGKFVDHVKRLINVHEKIISDHSNSEDEFQSPKRKKIAETDENPGVHVPETPEKETQTEAVSITPAKFFPALDLEGKEEQVHVSAKSSEESDKSENEATSSPDKVTESIHVKTNTDMDDDDADDVATVQVVEENREPSPEKITPLAESEEDLESSQEEAVVDQKMTAEVEEELHEDEETQQESKENEDEGEQIDAENESMEDDSLDSISVASSSSRSTRSRTSVRCSTRRSNRPSVHTRRSKSKRNSVLGRRSSVRHSIRKVTRASMKLQSQGAQPLLENLVSESEEEQQQSTPEFKPPGSGSRAPRKQVVDSTTQIRRTTRSRIKQSNTPGASEASNSHVQKAADSSEHFEDSLESDSRPPTRGSSRLKAKKISGSSTSSSRNDSFSPSRNRSTSPECPANKVIRPHPASFLNALMKKNKPHTPGTPSSVRAGSGLITSFIKRNTPVKKTLKEKQNEMKAQMAQKRKREEDIRKKLEAEKKNKIEEQKRKREERIRKVAEARQLRIQQQHKKHQAMEDKYQKKQVLSAQKQEEKRKEELQKRRQMMKKKVELEERRRLEEEVRQRKIQEQEQEAKRLEEFLLRKKEMEENERLRRIEEARQQDEERRIEMEKQRKMVAQKQLETQLAWERQQQHSKEEKDKERQELERKRFLESEEREKAIRAKEEAEEERRTAAERALRDRERQQEQQHIQEMMQKEKDKVEQDRLKTNILKHNTSLMNNSTNASKQLNTTITKETPQSPQSYEITPQRAHKPSTDDNYNIDDLRSDDSSDDEDAPRKIIPLWAKGADLKAALINQYYKPPLNLEEIFPPIMEAPDLTIIFKKRRERFLKRTSSAHWNSPIWKPGMF